MNNSNVRKLFLNYCDNHNSPSIKKLAVNIGLSYFTIIKWRNSSIDLSGKSLEKIITFISM